MSATTSAGCLPEEQRRRNCVRAAAGGGISAQAGLQAAHAAAPTTTYAVGEPDLPFSRLGACATHGLEQLVDLRYQPRRPAPEAAHTFET
jgi:hypothetical protein